MFCFVFIIIFFIYTKYKQKKNTKKMAELVKKCGTLKLHSEINDIIARVSLLISEIPEYGSLKLNHDLAVYVLNLVTNMVKSKSIDKEAIVIQLMTKVFELNDTEVANLKEQIAYLQSSGAVKRVSNLKLLYNAIKKKVTK
jgi:hypothetical protein